MELRLRVFLISFLFAAILFVLLADQSPVVIINKVDFPDQQKNEGSCMGVRLMTDQTKFKFQDGTTRNEPIDRNETIKGTISGNDRVFTFLPGGNASVRYKRQQEAIVDQSAMYGASRDPAGDPASAGCRVVVSIV